MKKILSLVLILSMFIIFPIDVSANGTSYDTGIVDLPQKSNGTTEIRTRKQVDGLRMYVDEENPLFMVRNCPIWGGPQTGEAFAEYAIKTYNALPEDIILFPFFPFIPIPKKFFPTAKFWVISAISSICFS